MSEHLFSNGTRDPVALRRGALSGDLYALSPADMLPDFPPLLGCLDHVNDHIRRGRAVFDAFVKRSPLHTHFVLTQVAGRVRWGEVLAGSPNPGSA